MALGGILAAALTDHSAHPRSLTIAGVDVIKQPGAGGNLYGVDIATISVDEQGPGAVSGMRFTIEDPLSLCSPQVGDEVVLWDHVNDVPLFRGWLTVPTYSVRQGNQGRFIECEVMGPEKYLDWSFWPGGVPAGSSAILSDVIQALVAGSVPAAPGIRAFQMVLAGVGPTQALPIGVLSSSITWPSVPAGTLRSAIQACIAARNKQFAISNPQVYSFTVDFWLGLRAWNTPGSAISLGSTGIPADYGTLTTSDAAGQRNSALSHTLDGGSVARQVQVTGGNAAATLAVSDGSGIPGQVISVSDATLLTADTAYAAGVAALAAAQVVQRGSLVLEDWTPSPATIHPGSPLVLTDAATGATGTYTVSAISKTFNPSSRENWTASYGGLPPSYVDLVS